MLPRGVNPVASIDEIPMKEIVRSTKEEIEIKSIQQIQIQVEVAKPVKIPKPPIIKDTVEVMFLDAVVELTRSQNKIYLLAVEGLSNDEIGSIVNLQEKAVKFHLSNVYLKCKVKNRAQLIVKHYKSLLKEILSKQQEVLCAG